MTRNANCFCGSYQRVGIHAYGCPADEPWLDDDEMQPEVCANCGAYFDSRENSKWQRCAPCRAGLERSA